MPTADTFSNFAVSSIAAGGSGSNLLSGETALTLAAGSGTLFPSSFPFYLVLGPDQVNPEIVAVTARSGDVCTVVRAQDGTASPGSWVFGTLVQHTLVAQNLRNLWTAVLNTPTTLNYDGGTITSDGAGQISALNLAVAGGSLSFPSGRTDPANDTEAKVTLSATNNKVDVVAGTAGLRIIKNSASSYVPLWSVDNAGNVIITGNAAVQGNLTITGSTSFSGVYAATQLAISGETAPYTLLTASPNGYVSTPTVLLKDDGTFVLRGNSAGVETTLISITPSNSVPATGSFHGTADNVPARGVIPGNLTLGPNHLLKLGVDTTSTNQGILQIGTDAHSGAQWILTATQSGDLSWWDNAHGRDALRLEYTSGAATVASLNVGGASSITGTATQGLTLGNPLAPPPAPTAVLQSGAGMGTGIYKYIVTYACDGMETLPSAPVSITTTAGNNQVTLTIPVSTDSRVTRRKIYRTAVGGTSYSWVATIGDNSSTTVLDGYADSSIAGGKVPPTVSTFGATLLSGSVYTGVSGIANSNTATSGSAVTYGVTPGAIAGDAMTAATFNATANARVFFGPNYQSFGWFQGNQPNSVLLRLKIASNPASTQDFFAMGASPLTAHGDYTLSVDSSGRLLFRINGATVVTGNALSTGTFHTVGYAWDGTTVRLLQDGIVAGSATPGAQTLNATQSGYYDVGGGIGGTNFFTGTLQEFVHFPYAISIAQNGLYHSLASAAFGNLTWVQQVYDDGPLHYYRLGDGSTATGVPDWARVYTSLTADGALNSVGGVRLDRGQISTDGSGVLYLNALKATNPGDVIVTGSEMDFQRNLSAGNRLLALQQNYGLWSDNTGGTFTGGTTRLWFDGPLNGEMHFGGRASVNVLAGIRFRAKVLTLNDNVTTQCLWSSPSNDGHQIFTQSTTPSGAAEGDIWIVA